MSHPQLHADVWTLSAAALAVVGGAFISRLLGRSPDSDEIERQRRAYLNQIGRIVEGQITDLVEVAEDKGRKGSKASDGRRKLVCYSYSISGVSYETAQDITSLQGRAGLELIITGLPASIKYDPSNPSNSILIADDWSGLR
ncbi:MAG: hypothetical protein DMG31_04345 [Acidobacteria bacterium]|nr:MAG: hypothetical protein DMG31_04345 [Acidobacteriota bacterium]